MDIINTRHCSFIFDSYYYVLLIVLVAHNDHLCGHYFLRERNLHANITSKHCVKIDAFKWNIFIKQLGREARSLLKDSIWILYTRVQIAKLRLKFIAS